MQPFFHNKYAKIAQKLIHISVLPHRSSINLISKLRSLEMTKLSYWKRIIYGCLRQQYPPSTFYWSSVLEMHCCDDWIIIILNINTLIFIYKKKKFPKVEKVKQKSSFLNVFFYDGANNFHRNGSTRHYQLLSSENFTISQ